MGRERERKRERNRSIPYGSVTPCIRIASYSTITHTVGGEQRRRLL